MVRGGCFLSENERRPASGWDAGLFPAGLLVMRRGGCRVEIDVVLVH